MTSGDGPGSDRTLLLDAGPGADLATFVSRAQRVDPGGSARLVAMGSLLAAYASPVNGGGGPTVLALRVQPLLAQAHVDVTVALAALADRFARLHRTPGEWPLSLPPAEPVGPSWAGLSPPRQGWTPVGEVGADDVTDVARRGGEEIVSGAPEGSGSSAVARLRGLVWGRPLTPHGRAPLDLPAGVAFALDAMGFVAPGEVLPVHAHGVWRRVSSTRGYVLSRTALL